MKRYLFTLITFFSLVYNQTTLAANFKQELKALDVMAVDYNNMRKNPTALASSMDKGDQKIYKDILEKGKVTELPEMIHASDGTYQLVVGVDRVIFDQKNWGQKKIIINSFTIDLSKITSLNQLIDTLSKVLSNKKETSGIFNIMKSFFISDVYGAAGSWWSSNTLLISAGLIAALGIGYVVFKNNKKNKSSETQSTGTQSTGTTSTSTTSTQPQPEGDCRDIDDPAQRHDGSGRFVWKPTSENDHKLVVLFPKGTSNNFCGIYDSNNNLLESGRYDKLYEDGRPYWRFSKAGSGYPANIKVCAGNGSSTGSSTSSGGTTTTGSSGDSKGECTKWDFSGNKACPAGLYNCDCYGDCQATAPCN